MPKNKGKGGKNRRRGKNENDVMKRELIKKDDTNQAYAQVLKMLGNGRLTAFCFDGKQRLCHIRGKLRKKVWINVGDIILVGLRDYQDDKVSFEFSSKNHDFSREIYLLISQGVLLFPIFLFHRKKIKASRIKSVQEQMLSTGLTSNVQNLHTNSKACEK